MTVLTNNINSNQRFTLGEVLVCPAQNQMLVNNQSIKLQPKVMSVLNYLAHNYKRVISSEELIETLWKGRVVTQSSVQKSINSLRKILNDYFPEQTVIENYSKKGYQLTIIPVFLASEPVILTSANNKRKRLVTMSIAVITIIAISIGWLTNNKQFDSNLLQATKSHNQHFKKVTILSQDTSVKTAYEPHPNNIHFAYVNKPDSNADLVNTSTLVITDQQKNLWQIATSSGTWQNISWSPDGQHLIAIENQATDKQTQSFYTKHAQLYTFHIFTLDITKQRLIEKQLLSQWHGQVNSVTWISNESFEFVATQGNNKQFSRYKYSPQQQLLATQPTNSLTQNVISSTAHNNKIAIISEANNKQFIHLTVDNIQVESWPISKEIDDVKWLPDGSGFVLYSTATQSLTLLYLDGKQLAIPLPKINNFDAVHPRFSADGKKIFYLQSQLPPQITKRTLSGSTQTIAEPFSYSAAYSNEGNQIIFAALDGNNSQLNLMDNEQSQLLLSLQGRSAKTEFIWSTNNSSFVYTHKNDIYLFDIKTTENRLLLKDSPFALIISMEPATNSIIGLITHDNLKNMWRWDLNKNTQKQLSFGSIGSVKQLRNLLYFQYIDQQGLWALDVNTDVISLIDSEFKTNSRLLFIDNTGVYYLSGGKCNESSVMLYAFATQNNTAFLQRASSNVHTNSFHPQQGDLYTQCQTATTDLVMFE